jgi:hypothetical protein
VLEHDPFCSTVCCQRAHGIVVRDYEAMQRYGTAFRIK